MHLLVNGETYHWVGAPERPTLASLLAARGVRADHVAVAVRGDIVPRERWADTLLAEGDEVEVVRAVAGGQGDEGPGEGPGKGPQEGPGDGDALVIAGRTLTSRLFLGTGKYPSLDVARAAIAASGTELVTVAIRYMDFGDGGVGGSILDEVDRSRVNLLPNTAGATTAAQAIRMANLARAALGTSWIKVEVIGDGPTLWPDTAATVEATRELVAQGFVVLPYTSPDPVVAMRLEEAGAATVMPLASPIGSGQGVRDWEGIARIVARAHVPVVVDAGIGAPSDAALAMELGAAAVLCNTAVARAGDPVGMAGAMRLAVTAGRMAFRAGRIPRSAEASPSSPTAGVVRG
jgi:thiazole synthase